MRILRILTRPNLGGPTRQAVALWHAHAALGVPTLLAVGTVGGGEGALDLEAAGVPTRDLAEVVGSWAGACVVEGLGRSPGVLRELRALRQLRRLIRCWRPTVVHTHTSKAGLLGRLAARAEGVPTVHTYHGHVFRDHLGWLGSRAARMVERRLARRTDLVLAVSPSCRDELAQLGVASAARVVAPAVPQPPVLPPDEARRRLGLRAEGVAVAFVGRMVAVKRPEVFAGLAARRSAWQWVAFGDGPRASVLADSAVVDLRPGRPDLPELLGAFDLLVMPGYREGFPLAGVEALAAGVPTVGFDVPGVRDLVRAAGCGALADPATGLDGLLEACEAVLQRGAGSAGKPPGAAASELLRRCDPNAVAAELRGLYQSLGSER